MALVPLRQYVTVYPPGNDDPWNPIPTVPFTLKCRFQESIEVVRNQYGAEVVSSAQIFLAKDAEVTVNHTFEYEDESGIKTTYTPHNVQPKRWLNGAPILKVVYV